MKPILALVALGGLGSTATAQQQSLSTRVASPAPAEAIAVRTPLPPVLDGRLDEDAWQSAEIVSDFTQRDPNEGQPGSERSEARILYTDNALYVGFRAFDRLAGEIAATLTRRDDDSPSDWLAVGIDSYHDRRTAFVFMVNPEGVKRDVYYFDDTNSDDSWDAVWDVAVTRDHQGWTAEFRIPFSQLRFATADEHRFGFNLYRKINRLNEEQFWRLPPKAESGMVSRWGDLVGIRGIQPPRRIEVMPYSAAGSTFERAEAGNPFRTGTDHTLRAGADLRIGVTSNLTLSATVNPDFGQVEADPAVVNLSAFESFFPERRPFFNEGLDIFRIPIGVGDGEGANESLFYTRRIGRAPQGSADDRGGYVEAIPQTTILGAAKLSGKTPGGWTIGLLGAVTAEEAARVVDAGGASFADVVEPRSTYAVGRLARDFRRGLTQVSLFGTAVDRDLPSNLSDLRSSAYTGGVAWTHRFRNDTYAIEGKLTGSRVQGSPAAMDRTQRSSARYFQRPDNDHVTYDPSRTSLSGAAGSLSVGKRGGGSWRFSTGVDFRTPGFEVNDLGYQQSADQAMQWVWVNKRWLQPGKVFRRFNLNFNEWQVWNFGGDRLNVGGNVNFNWTFLNYWGGYAGFNREGGGLSTGALRGGPAFMRPGGWNGWAGLYTDDRKPLRGQVNGSAGRSDDDAGWWMWMGTGLSWRAASNIDLSAAPSLSRQRDGWQYLATEDALGQSHYVFGELEQTTVSMTLRGNLTFAPNLTLQLYAEPFVSSGDYTRFKQVSDPRAATFAQRFDPFEADRLMVQDGEVSVDLDRDGAADLDLGNPDFSYLSLRSNVVMRWEYAPGSSLFVVWQHGRSHDTADGRFRLGQSLDDLFAAAQARNTFLVKVNYWISL
jgi:hypothetical protein